MLAKRSVQAFGSTKHVSGRTLVTLRATPQAGPTGLTNNSIGRPNYNVSLYDAMKFNGPAPELINARLAMLGFVNAAFHEVFYSEGLLQQVQQLDFGTFAVLGLWIAATLIPICKGVRNNEAFGPFSPQAEIINGRAAMLGMIALAALEYKAGMPFF